MLLKQLSLSLLFNVLLAIRKNGNCNDNNIEKNDDNNLREINNENNNNKSL